MSPWFDGKLRKITLFLTPNNNSTSLPPQQKNRPGTDEVDLNTFAECQGGLTPRGSPSPFPPASPQAFRESGVDGVVGVDGREEESELQK